MLKVAVPNKGALSEAAAAMLAEAGYHQRRSSKDLVSVDTENNVEFFYLRPRDIAIYVGAGTLDVGITGRDLLLDSGAKADEVMELGFASSTFRFAAPVGSMSSEADLHGKRIATSYSGVLQAHLSTLGIEASVVRLDGAVESSIRLGVADAIADVVETGTTMRQAGLETFGQAILSSSAVLISPGGQGRPEGFDVFKRRLESVIVARTYVMMDYDIPADQMEHVVRLTPGIESPTISPLHKDGWVAVRAMVPRVTTQKTMDELYALGARGILVTDILSCRI
jgi:ATP phosphoribosyltransferase